jgi:hypothetical protein
LPGAFLFPGPHPEERALRARLEGWAEASGASWFETRKMRSSP